MKKILLILSCIIFFPSCSVILAAKKEGTNITEIQSCQTRAQILSLGGTIISSERFPSGELVETYSLQKEKGSALRAVMHGLLDISSSFLWELAGTPIEGSLSKKQYFTIRVTYDTSDHVKKIELI